MAHRFPMGFRGILRWTHTICAAAVAVLTCGSMLATEAVRAELRIPPRQLHVIGDPIPLNWRFENQSSEPLGFMWEGCCRLNGRLSVEREGNSISSVSASNVLAHMFAKAERLLPGIPREFDTKLSDWVEVRESGVYHLQGRYVGVLPQQHPQVPRGLVLWTNAAQTGTIQLALLNPEDYLNRRDELAIKRGVNLKLAGPSRLSPLENKTWGVEIENLSSRAIRLEWPIDFSVWILDKTGTRLSAVKQEINASYEQMEIAAGGRLSKVIELDPDILEGEKFGNYRIFVDLKESAAGGSRVPSEAIPLEWNVNETQVLDLLKEAAGGSNVGIRNRPLKILRVYLGEIRHHLDNLKEVNLPAKTRELYEQLSLAATVRSVAPKPGRVHLVLQLEETGKWVFQNPTLEAAAASLAEPSRLNNLGSILRVRRHLGWDVGVAIAPQPETSMEQVAKLAKDLKVFQSELAAPVSLVMAGQDPLSGGSLNYQTDPYPKGWVLRMLNDGGREGIVVEGLATTRTKGGGRGEGETKPTQGLDQRYLRSVTELESWLEKGGNEMAEVTVLMAPQVIWRQITGLLGPLRRKGLQVHVGITAP